MSNHFCGFCSHAALLSSEHPAGSAPRPAAPPPPPPGRLTVSHQLQQSQVQRPLPARVLVQGDAVAGGGKHLPGADGHDLEKQTDDQALVLAGKPVQSQKSHSRRKVVVPAGE